MRDLIVSRNLFNIENRGRLSTRLPRRFREMSIKASDSLHTEGISARDHHKPVL